MIPNLLNRFFVGCENENIPKNVKKNTNVSIGASILSQAGGKNENFDEHFGAFKTPSFLMHGNGAKKSNELTTT
jgi:hypothetical protein